jgi:O-antigen/teichoic acid export membrane protein
MSRVTTLIVNIMVARYLGKHAFGQLALGLTLFHTFAIFSQLGLRTLITREVSRNRALSSMYLANGSAVVLVASTICAAVMFAVSCFVGYSSETVFVLFLLSLGLLPQALATISESVIRAWEKMHLIACANFPANILKMLVCYVGLAHGYGVTFVCLTLLLFHWLVFVFQLGMLLKFIGTPGRDAWDRVFAFKIARDGIPFTGLFGLIAVWPAISVVLLSRFYNELEVGLFNAGVQLITPVTLLFRNIMSSLFPLMCRRFDGGAESLRIVALRILEYSLVLAIPSAVGVFLLAESIVVLLYGPGFVASGNVLRIISPTIICIAITQTLGHVLLASHRERTTLRIVAVDLAASVMLGVPLIAYFGALGAAVTMLVSRLVDLWQHCDEVRKLLVARIPFGQLAWRAMVASCIMAIVVRELGSPGIIAPILLGSMAYFVAFVLLISHFRQRLLRSICRVCRGAV